MIVSYLINNLWVVVAALLVFTMTMSVGLLEVGELGESYSVGLLKTMLMTGAALVIMGFVGFYTAFAPTIHGVIGNPFYELPFLGAFSANSAGVLSGVWWSTGVAYFGTGLSAATYFLFEAAFASVTLALVGVIMLTKVKLKAMLLFTIPYFVLIWNLPAAWIWNPTGWLYEMGMRDFAGGLVVHAAAGAAGLAILVQIWSEEKRRGLSSSEKVPNKIQGVPLTLSILLLWMGWFGFNGGSVLAFDEGVLVVIITTFLAASAAMLSTAAAVYLSLRRNPNLLDASNGILMGLIVITPLAGFVSPGSAVVLGLVAGPLFIWAEGVFAKPKWFSDPVGLLPGHLTGGVFGILMIAFFAQTDFATASGTPGLANGLFFGGGSAALGQLGVEALGIGVVVATVFLLSLVSMRLIARVLGGITTYGTLDEAKESKAASGR